VQKIYLSATSLFVTVVRRMELDASRDSHDFTTSLIGSPQDSRIEMGWNPFELASHAPLRRRGVISLGPAVLVVGKEGSSAYTAGHELLFNQQQQD
jgi:hypothetical protein